MLKLLASDLERMPILEILSSQSLKLSLEFATSGTFTPSGGKILWDDFGLNIRLINVIKQTVINTRLPHYHVEYNTHRPINCVQQRRDWIVLKTTIDHDVRLVYPAQTRLSEVNVSIHFVK